MNFIDYYYILLLWIFLVFMFFMVWYAKISLQRLRRNLKTKPDKDYVRARILANKALKDSFSAIKYWAKETINFNSSTTKRLEIQSVYSLDSFWNWKQQDSILLNHLFKLIEKSIFTPEPITANHINDYIIASYGPEMILMDKLNAMYETLIKKCSNKKYVNAAIRFEIKQRCLKTPFDINGSKLCKKIETVLEETIKLREQNCLPLRYFLRYIYAYVSFYLFGRIQQFSLKMTEKSNPWENELLVLKVILCGMVAIALSMGLIHYGYYLECIALLFLLIINVWVTHYLRKDEKFKRYTLQSLLVEVTKSIFLVLGLHLYDVLSDCEVFAAYRNVLSCTRNFISHSIFLPDYSVMSYVKGLLNPDNTSWSPSEIYAPMICFTLSLAIAFYGLATTFKHTKNSIKLNLLINGECENASMSETIKRQTMKWQNDQQEELNGKGTAWVMSRYQDSINEGTSETLFQYLIQVSIWIMLKYWLSLAVVAEDLYPQNMETSLTDSSIQLNQTMLSSDDICGLKKVMVFGTIVKSSISCILGLTLAQFRANEIQHEYATSIKQKLLYFIACLANTVSYTTLFLVRIVNLFEVSLLASDTLQSTYPAYICILYVVLHYILTRFLINKLTTILCHHSFMNENVDIFPSKDKSSFILGLISYKWLQLPTSQTPQLRMGTKEVCFKSYHNMKCPQTLNAFTNQCVSYIVAIAELPIFAVANFYLLSFNPHLKKLWSQVDVSQSEISLSRRYFLCYSCFVIVFGWFLSYLFLYLYFRYDDGYFRSTRLQFEVSKPDCVDDQTMESRITGSWIDLNGLTRKPDAYQSWMHVNSTMLNLTPMVWNIDESWYNQNASSKDWSDSDLATFNEIKTSFPYYRQTKAI